MQAQETLDFDELSDRIAANVQIQQYTQDVEEAEAAGDEQPGEAASSSAGPSTPWITEPKSGRPIPNPIFGLQAKAEVKEELPATPPDPNREPDTVDLEADDAASEQPESAFDSAAATASGLTEWTETDSSAVRALVPLPASEAKAPPPTGVPAPPADWIPARPPKHPPPGFVWPENVDISEPPPPPQVPEEELGLTYDVVVPPPPPRPEEQPDPPSRQ